MTGWPHDFRPPSLHLGAGRSRCPPGAGDSRTLQAEPPGPDGAEAGTYWRLMSTSTAAMAAAMPGSLLSHSRTSGGSSG